MGKHILQRLNKCIVGVKLTGDLFGVWSRYPMKPCEQGLWGVFETVGAILHINECELLVHVCVRYSVSGFFLTIRSRYPMPSSSAARSSYSCSRAGRVAAITWA